MWILETTKILKGGYRTHSCTFRFETKLTAEIFIEMASSNWDSWTLSEKK